MNRRILPEPEQLAALAAYSGDPWISDNPYFIHAEPHGRGHWEYFSLPFLEGCDFSEVIDLAAGHGRNSVFLLERAGHLTITDIQPGNVEICRERFSGRTNIDFVVGSGYDFQPIADGETTLIYCFDAMVHFDSDVIRSYLRDAMRVLKPGGRGFFHHSNYTGGHDWRTNPNARNFMSKELFAHYAQKEGLKVLRQRTTIWDTTPDCDCLTLVERP